MTCTMWAIGWIFTIGYLRLPFWQGVLAIIIWPYYIGKDVAERYGHKHHS